MKISLNTIDRQKVARLEKVMDMNNDAIRLLNSYLTASPDFITRELIETICKECDLSEEGAFSNLLIAACGLDVENSIKDR